MPALRPYCAPGRVLESAESKLRSSLDAVAPTPRVLSADGYVDTGSRRPQFILATGVPSGFAGAVSHRLSWKPQR